MTLLFEKNRLSASWSLAIHGHVETPSLWIVCAEQHGRVRDAASVLFYGSGGLHTYGLVIMVANVARWRNNNKILVSRDCG